jgi:MFS family permease
LMVGAVLVGMGSGTEFGLLPCVIPRYFGVKSFSEVYGTIFGVSILASGFMPLFMGLSFDRNGNYNFGLILIATALICSAALIFLMPSFNSKSSPSISATESTSDREAERDQEVGAPNAHLMLVR